MKKIIVFLGLTLLSIWGCASGGKVMTAENFTEVSIGMTAKELEKKFGKPYSVKNLGQGQIEYMYIEKVGFGTRGIIAERHYLIVLKNGRVISSKTKTFNRPTYERNSYEMQTTQKE